MQLSVVVPCYNEEESVPMLVERLVQAIEPWAQDAEIILADDGSSDQTWAAIEAAHAKYPVVRGIRLSANRGHQVALTAGLEAARGARVFMLDADLQDPPEILPDMMMMMDRGYDVVYGRRAERQGETLFKKITAYGFYRFLNTLSDVDIPKDTGDFRLVSRRALDAVLAMPERARFIRGMFAWAGYKQIGLEYVRDARVAGVTKYPFRAMLRFATDALTGFSTKPLKMATRLAFLSLYVTFLMAVYVFLSLILHNTAPGWASMLLAISFFSGIQLLTLGIMGEYIGRLYMESKQRPMYFLSEETGTAAAADPVNIETAPRHKEAS
ncbi:MULTISPECIES: glycosyltransferase family 2 protein [unclassified Leisingera]|uniref:glycosyltransferase family 2 protein n=1 Tax=unclassified Leisingera TaxID=2614906 RepID=UPI001011C5C0|nr:MULTISPECIES: glycosyltransferase family 2 protein [unclassified Leisingera]MBQ4824041.1 glycosyltransferase family 2 protein [Leisingera sp. HS039]MCF6431572.1 glycosyltransferase family 2 protein [Leisingera sp. MMG026]QAX30825.1 glycosyltransferase [Leisingera sp. NJS204]QBR35204.1 glycosyltransferase [Leisingera sp. NJS201]